MSEDNTFEEQFPSLIDLTTECRGMEAINIVFIKEHCLDKQRVKKVITKCIHLDEFGRGGSEYINPSELLKELGLE